jgi:uncharacterized protein YoxC
MTWVEMVSGIADGVMTIAIVVLAVVVAPAAWSFWRSFRKVQELLDRVYGDVMPLMHHAHNIADNLDYITTSIRTDVQHVNATIASANRRLQQAVDLTENRLTEFNALLHVVQQEAEQAFVSTAAAVRGVRTGAATFGGLDEKLIDLTEGGDGDDDYDETDASAFDGDERSRETAARPRVRSRRGRVS